MAVLVVAIVTSLKTVQVQVQASTVDRKQHLALFTIYWPALVPSPSSLTVKRSSCGGLIGPMAQN